MQICLVNLVSVRRHLNLNKTSVFSVWMFPLWSTQVKRVANKCKQKASGILSDYSGLKCSLWNCIELIENAECKIWCDWRFDLLLTKKWAAMEGTSLMRAAVQRSFSLEILDKSLWLLKWLKRYLDLFYKVLAMSNLSLLMFKLYRWTLSVLFNNVTFYGGSSRWIVWTYLLALYS